MRELRIWPMALWVTALAVAACGAAKPDRRSLSPSGPAGLRLEHQILFTHGDDRQVFEGYMILTDQAFLVKAFAGPGVDLFTIAREGDRHQERLHIGVLADRIDVAKVGADIHRVYLMDCPPPHLPGEQTCLTGGETTVSKRDAEGRLAEKRFPQAHGVGLLVTYADYTPMAGQLLPKRITLSWGSSANRMVILLTAAKALAEVDTSLFEAALRIQEDR